jgi:anti-anti-sigma factor
MSATQIDTVISHHDRNVGDARFLTGTGEPRVVDFHRSIGSPFFGAVVSSCGIQTRVPDPFYAAEAEPRPTLVTLLGELDLSTGPVLRECFARIGGSIEVDCSGLDFVDAQGLGIFVTAHAQCQRTHATFVLVEPTRSLLKLLRITGLDARLEVRLNAAQPR